MVIGLPSGSEAYLCCSRLLMECYLPNVFSVALRSTLVLAGVGTWKKKVSYSPSIPFRKGIGRVPGVLLIYYLPSGFRAGVVWWK